MASELIIRKQDHEKIMSLLSLAPEEIEVRLQNELDRAKVVPDDQLPENVVAMNSTVTYLDLETNKENKITLVFPHEANVAEGKVSILAPIGAALIGLRVGDSIKWPLPSGSEREIRVTGVSKAAA